jgi:hypothetical protein
LSPCQDLVMTDAAIKAVDVFGNPHAPDSVGYCPCWQCPKLLRRLADGSSEWWRPKPQGLPMGETA